jgi:predicted transcriptional regulator
VIKLVDKLDDISDILEKADFKIEIYDDLTDVSSKLKGEVFLVDKEKQEVRVKLSEVYRQGFKSGISLVNDT